MNEVSIQVNTITDRDDFLYALKQTLEFYGKELDKMQSSFWWTACKDRPASKLKRALIEHTKVGRYAPRPAEILALVDSMNHYAGATSEMHKIPTTNCPPEIASAWVWFIGRTTQDSKKMQLFQKTPDIDTKMQEKYLHIVNHEAHKYGMPESIPEEFRLREVWG